MSKGNNRYLSSKHECNNNIIITPTTITLNILHNSDFLLLNPFRTLNIVIRTLLSLTSALSIAIILVYAINTIILFNAITTTAELHLLRSRPWFCPPPPPLNLFIATTQINHHFYPYQYLNHHYHYVIVKICTPCAVIITITVIMITHVIKTTIAMISTVLLKVLSK